jgi:hypothetical protein
MYRYLWRVALVAGLTLSVSTAAQTAPTPHRGGLPAPGTGVKATPAQNTPHFPVGKGVQVEQVRQLVQCGATMYAVGSFYTVVHGNHTYNRSNVFSFRATAPFTVTSWAPSVNGTVNSITFRRGKCSNAYIGGAFSSVDGTTAHDIAEISTTTGAIVNKFRHRATGEVETLLAAKDRILAGGFYKSINGSSADPYMTSLNPTTGKDDGFLHLKISGSYHFAGAVGNRTRVYNQQLSHGGSLDLVEGDFTSVGGQPRQQIFMLRLGRRHGSLTGWRSPEFDKHCSADVPFYVEAASWSPHDSTIYIATAGVHPHRWNRSFPLSGLCDAAAAFPATHASVTHKWINYTGCDSLYSTAADASTAYFGGHNRWSMNDKGCNFQGPGAYPATGMEGLSPRSGALYLNSARTAGYYSKARGYGADDMLLTRAGLWIASDNFDFSQTCGGVSGLAGICFLPYH